MTIYGNVLDNAKRFVFEYYTSYGEIALRFKSRFKFYNKIVSCNSMNKYGNWQKEEKHSNPFKVGSTFELRVINEKSGFKVNFFCNYCEIHYC